MTICEERPATILGEMLETVTKAEFEEAFVNLLQRPSYPEIALAEGHQPPEGITDRYHAAIDATRARIYDHTPGLTQKQKESADRDLLSSLFGGSDGSESRMVALGFKPAAFIGRCRIKEDMPMTDQKAGGIPLMDLSSDTIFRLHSEVNSDVRFTTSGVIPQAENYHAGFLYNVSAVEKVVARNADIFAALGYDVTKPGEELAEEIFTAEDSFAHSLLLGYSPASSALFYLQYPAELNMWGAYEPENISDQAQRYIDNYWRNMECILTPDQLALARTLAAKPELLEGFGVSDRVDYQRWYVHSDRNTPIQETWQTSGMAEYLTSIRKLLYGENRPLDEFPHNRF